MAHQADLEELLGVRVDGQGDRPDGTNIISMDEVSQSELSLFDLYIFKFQRQALSHARRTVDLDRFGPGGALPRRGKEPQ